MARPEPNTCSQKCGKAWEGAAASISILCAAVVSCARRAGQPEDTRTASNTERATVERPVPERMIPSQYERQVQFDESIYVIARMRYSVNASCQAFVLLIARRTFLCETTGTERPCHHQRRGQSNCPPG